MGKDVGFRLELYNLSLFDHASTSDLEIEMELQKMFIGACRKQIGTQPKPSYIEANVIQTQFIKKIKRNMLILGWER